jgi:glycerophosphoryl diester phosphodiesterase
VLFAAAVAVHSAPRIQVHGHRGARAVRPENTMAAFVYAIEQGADVVELDLAVTRDGVLVVSHDPVLPKQICQGEGAERVIRRMTLEELRQWDCGSPNPAFPRQQPAPGARIPTLDEVFELSSRGSFHFNIETKISPQHPEYAPAPDEFARLAIEAVRRHGLEARVILQSFDFRTLAAARRMGPEIRRAALYEGPPRDLIAMTREAAATILSPHYSLVTSRVVADAHAAGLTVTPWTANDPVVWDRLAAAGVDAIITDDPAGLIAWLRSRGLR